MTANIKFFSSGIPGAPQISAAAGSLVAALDAVLVTGWGSGWAVGNVLRFNTVGAMTPVWVVRTVQQGPNTGTEHSLNLLSRGDVDRT